MHVIRSGPSPEAVNPCSSPGGTTTTEPRVAAQTGHREEGRQTAELDIGVGEAVAEDDAHVRWLHAPTRERASHAIHGGVDVERIFPIEEIEQVLCAHLRDLGATFDHSVLRADDHRDVPVERLAMRRPHAARA